MQEFTAKEKDNRALPLDSSDEKVVYENPNNVSEGNDMIKAHHDQHLEASKWFEQLLPEGYCVGIRIALEADQISKCESHFDQKNEDCVIINDSEQIMTTANLLHSEEWTWGQKKIGSDASRTSYYLGRMALRSAMRSLLLLSSFEDDEAHHANKLLWEQIQSTPILKDGHGRPVLPEMIAGSISHKGDCAVAVARFRNEEAAFVGLLSRDDDSVRISNSDDKDCVHARHSDTKSSAVAWKEECPISTKENFDQETLLSKQNRTGYSTIEQTLGGIGIDLERIDGTRGRRIQSKVLTKREQKELGGLEAIGISKGEEVMLRFSLKESVYKAMHPILCEYVGFQEAEITPLPDGTATVVLNLASQSHLRLGMVVQTASWKRINGFFLTSSSVGVLGSE
ncbi:hypothetical protein ACHAXS_003709 [Conticribra weissflogii]